MRDVALTVFILGMLPVILARPWIGIVMWTWIGIMNPHRLTWGFAYDMPFAFMVAIATLIGFLVSREPKRFPATPRDDRAHRSFRLDDLHDGVRRFP